jgi:hypothetical protein
VADAPALPRRIAAEGLGAFFLFACVIGSGIMAQNLSQGNDAIALLANTLATGAILFVLITMLGPISGAHMNPAVSLVAAARGELSWRDAAAYIVAQFALGILGAWAAHLMFSLPTLQLSVKARGGPGQFAGEFVATFGLILTILGTVRYPANGSRRPSPSTSSPLTGSPRRPASPTRRSPSREALPTHSPALPRMTYRCSSLRSCLERSVRRHWRGGCSTSDNAECAGESRSKRG